MIVLDNAIKYSPAGERVEIRLRGGDRHADVSIRDRGCGIPTEDQIRIFDRFFRGEGAKEVAADGHGLGLPIARWIIEKHGGKIAVWSEPGEGTEVQIRLPMTG